MNSSILAKSQEGGITANELGKSSGENPDDLKILLASSERTEDNQMESDKNMLVIKKDSA